MEILEPDNRKTGGGNRRLAILGFVLALAAVFGFVIYCVGPGTAGNFFGKTAATISKTFNDILGAGSRSKLAAEIDLTSGRTEGLAGISPVSDAGPSAAVYAMAGAETAQQDSGGEVAAFGEENQKSNPTSAEISQGITSASVSKSAAGTALTSSTKTAKNNSSDAVCGFTAPASPGLQRGESSAPTRELIFNEIAWMGSVPQTGETVTQAANNEWIELRNISRDDIDLTGWQILDSSEKFKIVFADGEKLSAGGFYLLERADDDSVPGIKANKIYSGALSNSGMNLRLFGSDCALVDEVNATSGWPGGDNATKATMERNIGDFGWHTSAVLGGTPKAENSLPLLAATTSPSQILPQQNLGGQATAPDVYYTVGVSFQGDGGGTVTSSPPGIFCGVDCTESYKKGTLLALTATPDSNSSFIGWSSACSSTSLTTGNGTSTCSFTVTGTAAVVGIFKSVLPPTSPFAPSQPEQGASAVDHLVIAAIQIAGASTTNDFVKIYNPTGVAVDIGSWKLRKKTQAAADYTSVRVFSSGSTIQPQDYFLWANSENGFAQSLGANESSTQTLAANNSLAFLDSAGTIVDAVAWGSGHTAPYIEGSAYPDNPAANQVLSRKFVNGLIVDTDNNSEDFEIR